MSNHYLATVVLYADNNIVLNHIPLDKEDYEMSTSTTLSMYIIAFVMYILPSIGLFAVFLILVSDLNYGSYSFTEDLFFALGLGLFDLLWSLIAYGVLFRSSPIQAIFIEKCTLFWIGIPMIGLRQKEFQLTEDMTIKRVSKIELMLEGSDIVFSFMRKNFNTEIILENINQKLRNDCHML